MYISKPLLDKDDLENVILANMNKLLKVAKELGFHNKKEENGFMLEPLNTLHCVLNSDSHEKVKLCQKILDALINQLENNKLNSSQNVIAQRQLSSFTSHIKDVMPWKIYGRDISNTCAEILHALERILDAVHSNRGVAPVFI